MDQLRPALTIAGKGLGSFLGPNCLQITYVTAVKRSKLVECTFCQQNAPIGLGCKNFLKVPPDGWLVEQTALDSCARFTSHLLICSGVVLISLDGFTWKLVSQHKVANLSLVVRSRSFLLPSCFPPTALPSSKWRLWLIFHFLCNEFVLISSERCQLHLLVFLIGKGQGREVSLWSSR